jgi:hypothetical protein
MMCVRVEGVSLDKGVSVRASHRLDRWSGFHVKLVKLMTFVANH